MASDNEKKKCKSKTRYASDFEAQQSIARIRLKHGAGKSLRSYKCPVCFGYHVTSSPRR